MVYEILMPTGNPNEEDWSDITEQEYSEICEIALEEMLEKLVPIETPNLTEHA